MPNMLDGFSVILHTDPIEECPFCPGEEETPERKTHRGETNSASKLRSNMKKPGNLTKIQSGARPKDGKANHQPEDVKRPVYRKPGSAIYTHSEFGDYSDQAHHAVSGKQILNSHDIEKLTCKDKGEIEKDTGYSVNNCANGVCLPAYPNIYVKKSGAKYGTWKGEKQNFKTEIMELPMAEGKGQAHIGGHDIPPHPSILADSESEAADDATTDTPHHNNYPDFAKGLLQNLYNKSVNKYAAGCVFCEENKKNGKKLPPPYKINKEIDDISSVLIDEITGNAKDWRYFLSTYARDYTFKLKSPPPVGLEPPQ